MLRSESGWVIIPLHPVLGFLLQWWIPVIWWKRSWVLLPESFCYRPDEMCMLQYSSALFLFLFFSCDAVKSFQVFLEASFKTMCVSYLLTTQTSPTLQGCWWVIFHAAVELLCSKMVIILCRQLVCVCLLHTHTQPQRPVWRLRRGFKVELRLEFRLG